MFDDDTLEASVWKDLVELKMCQQLAQHENPARYDQFSTRLAMNLAVLREVGGQLFHLTLRAAIAADEIMEIVLTSTDAAPSRKK